MNTNVQINMPGPAANIARLAFSMFVHIADADKNITAQEVRRFQALLRETSWIDNEDLRNALHELQQKYSAFWANYEDGVFPVDIPAIATCVDQAGQDLGDEGSAKLRRSLNRFLDRLDGGTYGVKLVQGDQKARLQARKEIAALLTTGDEHRAKPAPRREAVVASAGKAIGVPAAVAARITEPVAAVPPAGPPATAGAVAAPVRPIWPAAALSPGQMPVWSGGRTKVRCVSVVWETDDTKTYSFVAEPQTLFHYKPGQFLTIEVPLPGSVLRRSYTISSSPSRPYTLSITVKKVPMGWMSNWLFDNMTVGFECAVMGPAGKFTCHDYPSSKMLFLAAGSGITPSMSMLRWLADTASSADIVFINNVRTPDDIIFHQELLHMSTRLSGGMRLAIVPAAVSPARPWHGPSGKLDEMLVRAYAPDFAERETFVCGPPGYMAAAKSMLAAMGLPMERYHDESFGAAPAPVPVPVGAAPVQAPPPRPAPVPALGPTAVPAAATAAAAALAQTVPPSAIRPPFVMPARPAPGTEPASRAASAAPAPKAAASAPQAVAAPVRQATTAIAVAQPVKTAKVALQGRPETFVVQPGQTILDAADASGVALTHSCRSGICGACKMHKVSGRVDMGEQSILSQSEIEAGYILTCVGKAMGDVTLAS